MDNLYYEDKFYEQKYLDLNSRLDSIYIQIGDVEDLLEENKRKKEAILEEKITRDNVYKILMNFDVLFSVLSDVDKRRLCNNLIDEIQIYDEKTEKGNWIKSLKFKIPIIK